MARYLVVMAFLAMFLVGCGPLTVRVELVQATPAPPARTVIREYSEPRADGSLWHVTQWTTAPVYTEELVRCKDGQLPGTFGWKDEAGEWEVTRLPNCDYAKRPAPAPAAPIQVNAGQPVRVAQAQPPAAPAAPAPAAPAASNRHETGKGKTQSFPAGSPVLGWIITIKGKQYNDCFFASAPAAGTVTDGAWGEVYPGEQKKAC